MVFLGMCDQIKHFWWFKKSFEVWINSAHYKGLRIATRDFKTKKSRPLLDKECKRATPTQWGSYAVASLVIKTLKNNEPKFLKDSITSTLYTTRRKPLIGRFYNNAKGKTGKQALHNRLEMMDRLDFDWIGQNLSDDRIRTYLKKTFFWQMEMRSQFFIILYILIDCEIVFCKPHTFLKLRCVWGKFHS